MASDSSLGTLLEATRAQRGMTLRALKGETGIPLTTLHRLFQDQVARPDLLHVAAIADALGAPRGPLFAAVGLPVLAGPGDVDATLRAAYAVPDHVIVEMRQAVDAVAARFAGTTGTGEAS